MERVHYFNVDSCTVANPGASSRRCRGVSDLAFTLDFGVFGVFWVFGDFGVFGVFCVFGDFFGDFAVFAFFAEGSRSRRCDR